MIARDALGRFLPGARANPLGRPRAAKGELQLSEALQDLVLAMAGRKLVVRQHSGRARVMTLFEARLRLLPRLSGRERRATWSFLQFARAAASQTAPRRRTEEIEHSQAVVRWAMEYGTDAEFEEALADRIALAPHPDEFSDEELFAAIISARSWLAESRAEDAC